MVENTPKISNEMMTRCISLLHRDDVQAFVNEANSNYWYWTDIKYKARPQDISAEEMWGAVKHSRIMSTILTWNNFNISLPVTNKMMQLCHNFDMNFGGAWGNSAIIPEADKERYLVSSLMEEAISSSQMEGASTTRKVAKDMLRKNISPRNKSEQMISNNYTSIRFIVDHKDDPLSADFLLHIHALMTSKTLQDQADEGKFRTSNDVVVENSITHEVVHNPPSYKEIPAFVQTLCGFVNKEPEGAFIHPILKAVFIHFMISYVHPFVDGNGRTARAMFYWYMLKSGYWLTEYLSISRIIYRSKSSYEKAFLFAEADNGDTGYFINYHLRVLELAFKDLKNYIERKILQKQKSIDFMRLGNINERQAAILSMLRNNPKLVFTIKELESRFAKSHTTIKNDVDSLVERGYLIKTAVNKVKSIYSKGDGFDDIV